LKAVTIRQPFATLVMAGVKRCENRTWPVRHRGLLIVHAAAAPPSGRDWPDVLPPGLDAGRLDLPPFRSLPLGAVLGAVDLFACLPHEDLAAEWAADPFARGPFCWLLRDPRPLAAPVVCRGGLGLWTWRADR
jgi:hypothetical protein